MKDCTRYERLPRNPYCVQSVKDTGAVYFQHLYSTCVTIVNSKLDTFFINGRLWRIGKILFLCIFIFILIGILIYIRGASSLVAVGRLTNTAAEKDSLVLNLCIYSFGDLRLKTFSRRISTE